MESSKPIYYSLFLLTVICLCTSFLCTQPIQKKAHLKVNNLFPENKMNGFAIVELFTSEGCSSCPPADELVSKIVSEKHKDVYVLAYHVDYWNRLGWKDVFSKPAWSARQQYYASKLGLDGVYTPQIVVNGTKEFVGSNESKLRNALSKVDKEPSASLTLSVKKISGEQLQVSFDALAKTSTDLNIALVQPEATTYVKRGENQGRKLHHVNIVMDLITTEISSNKGIVKIPIPKELNNTPLVLIAFLQQKQDGKILAVAKSEI